MSIPEKKLSASIDCHPFCWALLLLLLLPLPFLSGLLLLDLASDAYGVAWSWPRAKRAMEHGISTAPETPKNRNFDILCNEVHVNVTFRDDGRDQFQLRRYKL